MLSKENILLAYRNIKTNAGSNTSGTDGLTIKDIERLSPDEVVKQVRYIVSGSGHGYRPKPVRRKDIPKPNGSVRPLGIPCIWDRLIQQCILQILEPVCEAKFSNNSFGFRPSRSVENAIQATYKLLQTGHNHYIVEFDIKGFFDNVDHTKLIKQIWALGIHDVHLIYILRSILQAPIKLLNEEMIYPLKGTPQGGIISPLLANICLNELDQWIESQWINNPHAEIHNKVQYRKDGLQVKSNGYSWMRRHTQMKEMYIVRYADDFRIFCKTKSQANCIKIAVTQWLHERLRLEVSEEKTRIINVKRHSSEFLGFEIRLRRKGTKQVVQSHICKKARKRIENELKEQVKNIQKPRKNRNKTVLEEVNLYNSMVMGIQNYYKIATDVSSDCSDIQFRVKQTLTNRLNQQKGSRLLRYGDPLTDTERKRYGKSDMLRYTPVGEGRNKPIYPIGYVRHKKPTASKRGTTPYTPEGRACMHDNLRMNTSLMMQLMRQPIYNNNIEYADNRISLFSAQYGKCAVTGSEFICTEEIHCHHKIPKAQGGSDKYDNLVLINNDVHRLVHATQQETISKYLELLNLNANQLQKLNVLRAKAGLAIIA